ncbi:glutamate-1-semialdehyde aminotransferase [Trichoderma longibrachiatum]|uniref:Glutamate-1-semialdehyde aminotransferase n=1 Tax=Trichoderma longibrachiatum ATCC 18648 TaxID=983965 RepID=A0A2T4C979_TRILO|nr:glutamate-1-semialdehyde aminotransferase [Trichoderma longibrachiatum ATCC 18648]
MAEDLSRKISNAHNEAKALYVARNPISQAIHEEATKSLPGGNTRTVLYTDPFPICMKSAKGYQVTSEDDKTYTDFTGEFTAALYGHSNPVILDAITDVLQRVGMNVGATTAQEQLFAKELCRRFSLERVRFTNSGTEANLHALAAARLFTSKRKVVVFNRGYHGGVLGFKGGKPAPNNIDPDDWIVVKYNDLDAATKAIEGEGVAAVLVEGMQGNGGCIVSTEEFLTEIQIAAAKAGVVFILDEVMTSRISGSGFAGLRGLKPDLKTFGKYLGGGLAFGALGGRADIMAAFDPRLSTSISHSGTFNNNTLVTHAGYAGLKHVYTPEAADTFTETGSKLLSKLQEAVKGTRIVFTGLGSVMCSHFVDGDVQVKDVKSADDIQENELLKDLLWFEMLEQGFWVTRRGFIALVLETPQSELDRFVDAVQTFVAKYRDVLVL